MTPRGCVAEELKVAVNVSGDREKQTSDGNDERTPRTLDPSRLTSHRSNRTRNYVCRSQRNVKTRFGYAHCGDVRFWLSWA